jgi:phosphatidylglycerol:prolipoprotein diacylglycerol transferase
VHPFLLHAGHLTLPTFGVLAALGLMLALALSQYTARLAAADPDQLWSAGLFAVIAAFVLSRLLLVAEHLSSFLRFPLLLLAVPSLTPGGLLLTAIATFVWMRARRIPILSALDAWAPCATLVWAFLALGHFFEGSDPGMPTTLPIAVHMPGDTLAQHPVGLYVALLALAITAASILLLRLHPRPGNVTAMALVLSGAGQFFLSFLRSPELQSFLNIDTLQANAIGMVILGGLLYLAADSLRSTQPL